jgi:hypothetical protein
MSRSGTYPAAGDGGGSVERGSSLLAVLAVLALAMTLTAVLTLLSSAEARIAAADRDAREARYAAESGLDRALVDLRESSSWDDVLSGMTAASCAAGPRRVNLTDGRALDLDRETLAMQAITDAGSVRGPNTPRWRLYGWGSITDCLPASLDLTSSLFVAVWVADDEAEGDGRPEEDGNQAIWVRAVAYGAMSTRRSVEALVVRSAPAPGPLRRLVWRDTAGA